jgi:hypothetical protein
LRFVNPAFIASLQDCFPKQFRFAKASRNPEPDMRRSELWSAILPFFVALALGIVAVNRGQAAEGNTFIIAATDGYGVEDCLAEGGECGHVVADAWCEAHGHGAALSFGLAEDITNAIPAGAAGKTGTPYIVRCGD